MPIEDSNSRPASKQNAEVVACWELLVTTDSVKGAGLVWPSCFKWRSLDVACKYRLFPLQPSQIQHSAIFVGEMHDGR